MRDTLREILFGIAVGCVVTIILWVVIEAIA